MYVCPFPLRVLTRFLACSVFTASSSLLFFWFFYIFLFLSLSVSLVVMSTASQYCRSDADLDTTYALLMASELWNFSSQGSNAEESHNLYKDQAQNYLAFLWNDIVDPQSFVLKPRVDVQASNCTAPAYYSPAYYEAFSELDQNNTHLWPEAYHFFLPLPLFIPFLLWLFYLLCLSSSALPLFLWVTSSFFSVSCFLCPVSLLSPLPHSSSSSFSSSFSPYSLLLPRIVFVRACVCVRVGDLPVSLSTIVFLSLLLCQPSAFYVLRLLFVVWSYFLQPIPMLPPFLFSPSPLLSLTLAIFILTRNRSLITVIKC